MFNEPTSVTMDALPAVPERERGAEAGPNGAKHLRTIYNITVFLGF